MPECVERDAAIEAIRNRESADKFCVNEGLIIAMNAVAEIPAADARPVVRGEWKDHVQGRWVYAKCSECETVHDVKSNFCPTCGADMRIEPKEET